MKDSIAKKLLTLVDRHQEISALLSDPEVIQDQNRYRELSKQYALLEPIVEAFKDYTSKKAAIQSAQELLDQGDPEFKALAEEEIKTLQKQQQETITDIERLLLPKDPDDDCQVFLEIRAGAGGDEAALFVGDLFRMYMRYAEQKGWPYRVVSLHESEQGGFKEIIVEIAATGAYEKLKFESGVHRVQRVPVTESQGRLHTSTVTVAVMPVVEAIHHIEIDPANLRIDTYRASGAGGQHVNKTDSAVRITHLPSGLVVECQDERSQHKNKAKALSLLQSKLLSLAKSKQEQAQADERRLLIGSGDRSERIRTYNFPQGRVTDHRIHLTLYQIDTIMDGALDAVIDPLIRELQADQLARLREE